MTFATINYYKKALIIITLKIYSKYEEKAEHTTKYILLGNMRNGKRC